MKTAQRLPFAPTLPDGSNATSLLRAFAREISALPKFESEKEKAVAIETCRRRAVKGKSRCDASARQAFIASIHVLTDLAKQGWTVVVDGDAIEISREENGNVSGDEARDRIRGQLHAERDEQLRQPPTMAFIKSMETRQLFKGQFTSIFSLMRDGNDLAAKLNAVTSAKGDAQFDTAKTIVAPYVQFLRNENERCPWTGLRLMDIWRYFRHTWANPYKSVPGRTMMAIVRDSAAVCHPVIGIAALSSAAVAVTARDEKIGWNASTVIEEIRRKPTARMAEWLQQTVDSSIDELYKVDFFEDDLVTTKGLKHRTDHLIQALEDEGRQQRKEHHRFMGSGEYKKSESAQDLTEQHWELQARSSLFRSKRALELANLLRIRKVLWSFFRGKPQKNLLTEFINDRAGKDAVAKIVRKAKSERVGTAIADLTVCGAVPPYNELLGGKLVAMLMVGPEVVVEYRRRYGGLPSVIASSMCGKPICRAAELTFIGTTSLYGQRPSQYDRISIPLSLSDSAKAALRYEYLGRTRGIGTFQFNEQTVTEFAVLLAQSKRGQQVNSVFGEGVNPRLRKIRDGLDALGLPSDDLLNHGGPRLVYGVELSKNTHAYLLGIDKHPKYIVPQKMAKEFSELIGHWWLKRWVLSRVAKDGIIERVGSHKLTHPIRHGARVELPLGEND